MKQFLLVATIAVLLLTSMRTCGQFDDDFSKYRRSAPGNRGQMYKRPVIINEQMSAQLAKLKNELEYALRQVRQRADFGELGMQKVLTLLDLELNIVDHLLAGETGYGIEQAMQGRNNVLHHSIPSVVQLYDMVLDLATTHAQLEKRLRTYAARHEKGLWRALDSGDKHAFLLHMADTLEYYYNMIQNMQYASVRLR